MLVQPPARSKDLCKHLHPRLVKWFRATYCNFTDAQLRCVPAILERKSQRELLVNIGTIVSESFVDVLLRHRRLGSVEEGFIKQLHIGDVFVLGGRVVRLIDTGVQEAHVERADGAALERCENAAHLRPRPRRARTPC